jgi:ribosomal protein L37AE/L43A
MKVGDRVMTPHVHIAMSGAWSPLKRYCPFCDAEVDGIYREAYGGYIDDWVCGFCGTWIRSGEYNPHISQSERRRNVALVERELKEADDA